jgi:glycerate 2-kinase
MTTRHQLITRAYLAGLARVAPDEAVRRVLRFDDGTLHIDDDAVAVTGRLIAVAIGKAAAPMAAAVADTVGDRLDAGYLLTKDGHAKGVPEGFREFEAAHPVPDERGVAASRVIVDAMDNLGPADVVIALISGGGSALFEAPVCGVTLADIQRTTTLLLRAGAPIQELNAVRAELSQVKGGGLRRSIGQAKTVSLVLSDVLGNPPDIIASGPTVPRDPDPGKAIAVLERYGIRHEVPASVKLQLARLDTGSRSDIEREKDVYRIVGDNETFVAAVESYLKGEGFAVNRMWRNREGEAREQAGAWVDALASQGDEVILGGGELTVTVRGSGMGGRNTEFALAAAIQLAARGIEGTVASLASDGQDGSIDAAGGVVDHGTVRDLREAGYDPGETLEHNDSGNALAAVGALIAPGPTGTNVNDVYIGMRHR